jgi:hypothetical protein
MAFTIFAKAERELGDKKEKYFWLINAPSDTESSQSQTNLNMC